MKHKLSGRFVLRLPQSLHSGLVKAAEKEGVSLNQYCLELVFLFLYLFLDYIFGQKEH